MRRRRGRLATSLRGLRRDLIARGLGKSPRHCHILLLRPYECDRRAPAMRGPGEGHEEAGPHSRHDMLPRQRHHRHARPQIVCGRGMRAYCGGVERHVTLAEPAHVVAHGHLVGEDHPPTNLWRRRCAQRRIHSGALPQQPQLTFHRCRPPADPSRTRPPVAWRMRDPAPRREAVGVYLVPLVMVAQEHRRRVEPLPPHVSTTRIRLHPLSWHNAVTFLLWRRKQS